MLDSSVNKVFKENDQMVYKYIFPFLFLYFKSPKITILGSKLGSIMQPLTQDL